MASFRARQLEAIRNAVAEGRAAMRAAGRFEPEVFVRAFVAAGGVQIPGRPKDDAAREALAGRLIQAVSRHEFLDVGDRDLQREIDRARTEAKWTAAQADDKIVGFFLMVPGKVADTPAGKAAGRADQGFGAGVYRKADILVLQPELDGARFVPVLEDEIEC